MPNYKCILGFADCPVCKPPPNNNKENENVSNETTIETKVEAPANQNGNWEFKVKPDGGGGGVLVTLVNPNTGEERKVVHAKLGAAYSLSGRDSNRVSIFPNNKISLGTTLKIEDLTEVKASAFSF